MIFGSALPFKKSTTETKELKDKEWIYRHKGSITSKEPSNPNLVRPAAESLSW